MKMNLFMFFRHILAGASLLRRYRGCVCRNHEQLLLSICAVGTLFFASCSRHPGVRISPYQYPFLAHSGTKTGIIWHKYTGPDFDVFYGSLRTNKTSGFGFYLGGHPNFQPPGNAQLINTKLGAFSVDWSEKYLANPPRVRREAVFDYKTRLIKYQDKQFKYITQVHIWIYGANEQEILKLTDYLSGLKLFREKPEIEIRERK